MSTYIAIDKNYNIQKLTGIRGVVTFVNMLRHKDGQPVTFKSASDEFKKQRSLDVYDYEFSLLNGLLAGQIKPCDDQLPCWKYKIHRI